MIFLFIGNNIATRGVANQTKTIKLVWDSDFIFLMNILFFCSGLRTQNQMVKMVRKTMMAMTHDGAETQMVAQRVETMVTVTLSANGADRLTMVERHRGSRTRSTGSVCDLPAHTSCLLAGRLLLF